MTIFFLLPFVAGTCALLLAIVSLRQRRPSIAWSFFIAGMAALALDSIFTGLSLYAAQSGDLTAWLAPAFVAKSFVPVLWLGFALTYSRSNYSEFLRRWALALGLFALLPVAVAATLLARGSGDDASNLWWLRPGLMTTTFDVTVIVALVLILTNLEQTFRSAVGTMRWQVKFVVIGLAIVFAARLYVRTQAILLAAPDIGFWSMESSALLIGCAFLAVAYARTRLVESDVYPSLAVLRSSLTLLVVGAYLFVVGVLAKLVTFFGGAEILQLQAVVVILGVAGLAVLLLSDRTRQRIQAFVVSHFSKAQHDSVRVWTLFSRRLAGVNEQGELCAASAKLMSETFDVLSVTVWLADEDAQRMTLAASTSQPLSSARTEAASIAVAAGLQNRSTPFDLDHVDDPWAKEFRGLNPSTFATGGHRLCVPLRSGERTIGAIVMADRVNAALYTHEEIELLRCIGDHMTGVLLNLRLAHEVAHARELEAFRLMSTFFVHDLKNAASSLNLTLKNLPVHFDDPAFRADALRTIGNTARRIDDMIAKLSALRQRPEAARVEADLNQLVDDALAKVNDMADVTVTKDLQPLPRILADREQIQSVVTNLVLNAREAIAHDGVIQVRTQNDGMRVVLTVADNGCGMSRAFVKESLFRPFQTTKKKGLGIGLFQCRAIVQSHGGGMQVVSEEGKGTTFLVSLPVKSAP